MHPLIETLLEEFSRTIEATKGAVERLARFPKAPGMIKVAMGMRRSGKTYFLFQTVRDLLKEGVDKRQIFHINFEDDRLLPMTAKQMGELIDGWYALYPENHDRTAYLFLDEVQNIDGWPQVLRRLLDTKNIELFVTGSSSKLLSKEIATSLRGRTIAIEIFPYNYLEFLTAQHLEAPKKPFGKRSQDHHMQHLASFFQIGGFPAIQTIPPFERLETLQSYVETVIFRDIIERHQITNTSLMKYFIHTLLKNIAAPFSIHKFYNDLKSQGQKVGKDTLHTYLGHLEDAYMLFTVPLFSESLRKQETSPKKIYAIDNALAQSNTFNLSENFGKLLENLVYLDLKRSGKRVFYYVTKSGYEIDFVTQDRMGGFEMIQVVWDLEDSETQEREERALKEAEAELGIRGHLLDPVAYLKSFLN